MFLLAILLPFQLIEFTQNILQNTTQQIYINLTYNIDRSNYIIPVLFISFATIGILVGEKLGMRMFVGFVVGVDVGDSVGISENPNCVQFIYT